MRISAGHALLFSAGEMRAVALTLDDAVQLQQLFDANPGYFQTISGQAARPDTALEELEGDVPKEFSYSNQMVLGFLSRDAQLLAMASVVSDLLAPGVWHIGLFMVDGAHHGRGLGRQLYQALERWIEARGARWIRLGVVIGNQPAERFWAGQQFVEVTVRRGVEMERRVNDVRVMVKPLGDNLLGDYRARVPRDQPADA